jgi:hypothetical protein
MIDFDTFLIEVTISLQYHDTFNKKLWGGDKLDPLVRKKLLDIAEVWRIFANIPGPAVKDIVLTGGNANYNYTDFSDLDVHLVVDQKQISSDTSLLFDYFMSKKALWADNHNITIRGLPVELFAQPTSDKAHKGQGVYSLQEDVWLQKPQHEGYNFQEDKQLMRKVDYYIKRINDTVGSKSHNDSAVYALKTKLQQMRGAAIAKGGEFSFENLVYKELRNQGAIAKLSKYLRQRKDAELSLI